MWNMRIHSLQGNGVDAYAKTARIYDGDTDGRDTVEKKAVSTRCPKMGVSVVVLED